MGDSGVASPRTCCARLAKSRFAVADQAAAIHTDSAVADQTAASHADGASAHDACRVAPSWRGSLHASGGQTASIDAASAWSSRLATPGWMGSTLFQDAQAVLLLQHRDASVRVDVT